MQRASVIARHPGIDVVYYGSGPDVEFDFVPVAGADPGRIQLAISGPELKLKEPRIYQDGRAVEGRAVRNGNRVTFELCCTAFDRSRSVVIDPVIGFATLAGGASLDIGSAIAVDRTGASYVPGTSYWPNLPATGVPSRNGTWARAFVIKLSANGSTVLYST